MRSRWSLFDFDFPRNNGKLTYFCDKVQVKKEKKECNAKAYKKKEKEWERKKTDCHSKKIVISWKSN